MAIKTDPHPPYSPDLASCDFWLFPKLRGCLYETTEWMKEAVTKVIDILTQKEFYGPSRSCWNGTTSALQTETITSKGSGVPMGVLSIKVAIRKKSGNFFIDTRIYLIYIQDLVVNNFQGLILNYSKSISKWI